MSPRNKVGSSLFGVQQCQVLCVYTVVTPAGAGEPWSDAGNALSCDSYDTDDTHTNCLWCCVRYPCVRDSHPVDCHSA